MVSEAIQRDDMKISEAMSELYLPVSSRLNASLYTLLSLATLCSGPQSPVWLSHSLTAPRFVVSLLRSAVHRSLSHLFSLSFGGSLYISPKREGKIWAQRHYQPRKPSTGLLFGRYATLIIQRDDRRMDSWNLEDKRHSSSRIFSIRPLVVSFITFQN